ncbi:MAG: hypothetical protein ACM3JH_14100 [Acidithiobacillales bacterium]
MSAPTPSQGEIRDYLLRRLPEARRARLEELYFSDDRILDRVEDAEDQLVSDYVLGRLSTADRKVFEDALLAMPYYRDRIETTTQMRLRLSRHKAFLRGSWRASGLWPGRTGLLVAVALLFVLFVAALASALRLKRDLETATTDAARPARAELPARALVLPRENGNPSAPLRVLGPAARPFLLVVPQALLPDQARLWRLTLQSGSESVWQSNAVRVGAEGDGDVALRLPAGVPAPGRYEVVAVADGDPSSARALATVEVVGAPR